MKIKSPSLFVLLFLLFTLLFSVYLTGQRVEMRKRAATIPSLYLSPASGSVSGTFTIDVQVDTAGAEVSGVDVILSYEPSQLEAQEIQDGDFSSYPAKEINQVNGKIRISAIAAATSPFSGTGKVAMIVFKALQASGTASLNFDFTPGATTDCNLVEYQTVKEILGSVTNGSYTLAPMPTPSQPSTPTPTPSGPVDLDVTYIERLPRYQKYCLEYPNGLPVLCPGTETEKRWPDEGETVTFVAHIINKGEAESGDFQFKWFIDEKEVASGSHTSLSPHQEITERLQLPWINGPHTIKFVVDSQNSITEISEANNGVKDRTDALSFKIFFSTEQYNAFNSVKNRMGSYSAEDWIKDQFDAMRDRFEKAKYPLTPNGIEEVIRIDKIVVVPNSQIPEAMNSDPDRWTIDGRWQFWCPSGETVECQGNRYNGCNTNPQGFTNCYAQKYQNSTDWGLIHELTHQLGIIDLYHFNLRPENNHVVPGLGKSQPNPGIMVGGDTSPYYDSTYYSSHTAIALNLNKGYRRGYYGEYLYDVPRQNKLKILNIDGQPLSGAEISVYQREGDIIDTTPEMTGFTDQNGIFVLPNQQASYHTTETGHTLRPSPFGKINVVGTNGIFLIEISKFEQTEYHFLDLGQFNLAYWRGNKDEATYTISTNFSTITVSQIGDFNQDGQVDDLDLEILAGEYGPDRFGSPADCNGDGSVDSADVQILIENLSK